MDKLDQELTDQSKALERTARDIISWVDRNEALVRQDKAALLKDFRRFATSAGRLSAAAARPMCVGVYGPSQNGKSHLIATLARKAGNPALMTRLGDREVDFIEEINPVGGSGRESTGVVTRFSLRPFEAKAPADAPVCVRLLSQSDLVKIIGNFYYSDLQPTDVDPPAQDAIDSLFEELGRSAAAVPVDPLTAEAVFELQTYFEQNFGGHAIVRELRKSYWGITAELAPRLRIADRARLFGAIWGNEPKLIDVYQRLYRALEKLEFGTHAFAGMDALHPRDKSIVNVDTLRGLGEDHPEELTLVTASGSRVMLARCDTTAVVAELHLQMTDKPHEFFEHTDLLDFPGARSREQVKENITGYLEDPEGLFNVFRRGKVAYLFERYCAEQELTSMLLCMNDQQPNVNSLPDTVNKWVAATHGDTPERRGAATTSLFFILTWFDNMFKVKAGDGTPEAKWTTRVEVPLVNFFGGPQYDWPRTWDRRGPFRNCFWFRNTTITSEDIFEYDTEGREVALLPSKQPSIETLRAGFLNAPEANCHFEDPARAFDAGLMINDGGATYLAEKLTPTCNPELKRQQITAQLERLRDAMAKRISPWFVSGDPEEQLERRRTSARSVAQSLIGCAHLQRFGELLSHLHVTEEDLEAAYYRIEMGMSAGGSDEMVIGRSPAEREMEEAIFGDDHSDPRTSPRLRDDAQRFAENVIEAWFRDMHDLAANEAFCDSVKVPSEQAADLVKEIVDGAKRLDLEREIAETVRDSTAMRMKFPKLVKLPVRRSAHLINSYVNKLGYDAVDPSERPRTKSRVDARAIFLSPNSPIGIPEIPDQPSRFEQRYFIDWICGFLDLVEKNACVENGNMVNIEANRELGKYVAELA
jgi:hypothetical protein